MAGIMWGSWLILYFFSRVSDYIKRFRRQRYVKQIKVSTFHAKFQRHALMMCRKQTDTEEQPTCAICLCEFNDGDKLKVLRCGHSFHSECIDPWLINEKALCPVCRRGIFQVEDWVAFTMSLNGRTFWKRTRAATLI